MSLSTFRVALLSVGLTMSMAASAAQIIGLQNSGAGVTPPLTSVASTNYDVWRVASTLNGAPNTTQTFVDAFVSPLSGIAAQRWLGNNLTSAWLTPTSGTDSSLDRGSATTPNGQYLYRLDFRLEADAPTPVSVAGRWLIAMRSSQ